MWWLQTQNTSAIMSSSSPPAREAGSSEALDQQPHVDITVTAAPPSLGRVPSTGRVGGALRVPSTVTFEEDHHHAAAATSPSSGGPGTGQLLRRRFSAVDISTVSVEDILHRAHEDGGGRGQVVQEAHSAIQVLEESTPWHALTTRDCLRVVGMRHPEKGLTGPEIIERRKLLGENKLEEGKSRTLWAIILPQFFNWMTAILFGVLAIALAMSEYIEAVVVILVILLNSSIGAYQELRSEQSLNAIRDLARGTARVRRDGVVRTVDMQEVVVGDILEFREGDRVAADVRLLEATRLEIDESALTGESVPVSKTSAVLQDPHLDLALGDRINMAFRQTWVTQGHGTGLVVAVGTSTQIGKVAERLTAGRSGPSKTPLMKEMDALMLILFLVGLVFGMFIIWSFRWTVDSSSLLYASATLVAILPEVCFVLLSVVMAVGSSRMAEQRAIVRRLTSLERLGKVTDICSDKTGTLTAGKMQAVRVWLASEIGVGEASEDLVARPLVAAGRPMHTSGSWHREVHGEPVPVMASSGPYSQSVLELVDEELHEVHEVEELRMHRQQQQAHAHAAFLDHPIEYPPVKERRRLPSVEQQAILTQEWTLAMMVASLCSSTYVEITDEGTLTGTGNPTELALQVLAHQGNLAREAFMVDWEPRGEWSFDSTAKRMSTGWRHRDLPIGLVLTKGAPERILSICNNVDDVALVEKAAAHLARQGLRVLALAYRLVRNGAPLRGAVEGGEEDGVASGSFIHQSRRHSVQRSLSTHSIDSQSSTSSRRSHVARRSRSTIASPDSVVAVRNMVTSPILAAFLAHQGSDAVDVVDVEVMGEDIPEIIDLREQMLGDYDRDDVERDLVFLGLVGLRDPPKPESGPAVQECDQAGITVRMLTGDHRETAVAIAEEIGILKAEYLKVESVGMLGDVEAPAPDADGEPLDWKHLVMTGPEMDAMAPEQLDALPDLPLVVARCTPETKVRMVEALHRRSCIVAMTGDGVNDSPAIQAADIGVAMGITGSELTKSVADVVLADDNFATIVSAVREGRRMFSSISKFVLNLLCSNVAEAVVLMLSLAFVKDRDDLPVFVLSPLAILWLNTITGTGPSLGISLDPISPDTMSRPPLKDTLFTKELVIDTLVYGTLMGIISLCSFIVVVWGDGVVDLGQGCNKSNSSSASGCDMALRGRATAFASLNMLLVLQAFNCRHDRLSAFSMSWVKNKTLLWSLVSTAIFSVVLIYIPFINTSVFKHDHISWEWGVVVAGIVLFHLGSELYKYVKRRRWAARKKHKRRMKRMKDEEEKKAQQRQDQQPAHPPVSPDDRHEDLPLEIPT